jgi:N6-adenosine-specific RNA methylase IME4
MIDHDVVKKMREKYSSVYPLIFSRSVERSRSPGDLFDILESLPAELPVYWDEESHRWRTTDDLTQAAQFEFPSE